VALNSAWARETGRSPNRRFEFDKRSQQFIRTHYKTLSVVAVCVNNPDRSPENQSLRRNPNLQPVLLRISAPSFLLASRSLLAITHQQRIRPWRAADLLRRSASGRAKMLLELFKTHRCQLLALGWLRQWPAPFRVPSNSPAATTNIAIAPSATAQSRIMIRWSLFMIAPPSGSFSSLRFD
jgi:hypothetical protein